MSLSLLLKSIAIVLLVGLQVALFMWGFHNAFEFWHANPWALWCLPAIGLITVATQRRLRSGLRSTSGILQNMTTEAGQVAWYAAPFALIFTCLSQAFGASTGREGTAVHIGAGTAEGIHQLFPSPKTWQREFLLRLALAAGFGGVFNTPFAGAIFALESDGHWKRWKWLPCFLGGSFASTWIRNALVTHVHIFPEVTGFADSWQRTFISLALLTIVVGIFGRTFTGFFLGLEVFFSRRNPYVAVLLSTLAIVGLTELAGTFLYNDLGVTLIRASFENAAIDWRDALMKALYTLLSATGGLKGGEVTPILSIGAALGRSVATWSSVEAAPFIAISSAAFFGVIAGSPLTAAVLGAEYFGIWCAPIIFIVAWIGTRWGGHVSLYKIPH